MCESFVVIINFTAVFYSFQIAERLRAIGDSVDREYHTAVRAEIEQAIMKLLFSQSVFTLNKEHFVSVCSAVLQKFQQQLTSGWQKVYVVYDGEFFFFFFFFFILVENLV